MVRIGKLIAAFAESLSPTGCSSIKQQDVIPTLNAVKPLPAIGSQLGKPMKTSLKLDLALIRIAGALALILTLAVCFVTATRDQAHKPGLKDPTVEWWVAGEPVACKHPQTNWPNTDWACPFSK